MDLKSIFSREKTGANNGLPQPPNIREMIEDIESSSKDDPVILLANYLQKKGNRKTSLNGIDFDVDLTDAVNAGNLPTRNRKGSESDSVSVSSTATETSQQHLSDVPEIPSPSTFSDTLRDSADPTENIYYKLRQFISLSEQTQTATLDIETKLKQFERDNKDFINILGTK